MYLSVLCRKSCPVIQNLGESISLANVIMIVPSIFSVAQLRERSVYVQFSNHKELKTDQTHSNASASAQAALQAAQALIGQDAQVAAGNVAAGLQGAITPKIQHTASVNGHGASGGELVPTTYLKLIGKVCPLRETQEPRYSTSGTPD